MDPVVEPEVGSCLDGKYSGTQFFQVIIAMLSGGELGKFRKPIQGERKKVETFPLAPKGSDPKLSTFPIC